MEEEDIQESAERYFQAYGRPLETVNSLKYLGQVLTAEENDWTAVVGQLEKARKSWSWLTRILGAGGSPLLGIRDIFQGGSSGGVAFRVGDVGDDPPHGPSPGNVSAQCHASDHE